MPVLIVGSVALDTVKTPVEEHADLLGGSASYAAVAASFFTDAQLVGIVGEDFPPAHVDYFQSRKIDLEGLQRVPGQSFRYSCEYMVDMNDRVTLETALNVFEDFQPHLPPAYQQTPHVLLANIHPALQSYVLDQMARPRFVIVDTMNLWINIAKEGLLTLLKRTDMLILNDSEAKLLTGEHNLIRAAQIIRGYGPAYVAIKKGEHGCLLFGPGEGEFFSCPAFPLANLHDPTGAGDCFAGGLIGSLAQENQATITFDALKKAVVSGSVVASFNVEAFSLERLRTLQPDDITARYTEFERMSRF